MTLLITLAQAAIVGDISEPVQFELAGTFARIFPADEGHWDVALGAGRGIKFQTVDDDLGSVSQFEDALTDQGFIDIAVTPCPDGGWLVAGSGNVDSHNDTLWAYRLDANKQVVGNSTVVDRQQNANTNDMVAICTNTVTGVGWANNFAFLDDQAQVTGTRSMSEFLMGAGMVVVDGLVYITAAGGPDPKNITLVVTDGNLDVQDTRTLEVDVGGDRVYWPQRMLKLDEDTWVIVSMGRDNSQFQADEGNVYLHFYDASWTHLETTQISQYEGPLGCMRPWVSRSGDTLMVSWDSEIRPYGVRVTMGGVGSIDTADPADSGDSGDSGGPGDGCGGCGGGSGAGLVLLALPLMLRRRRIGQSSLFG